MGLPQSDLFSLPKVSKPLRACILDEFCQVCGTTANVASVCSTIQHPNNPRSTPSPSPLPMAQGHLLSYGFLRGRGLSVLWAPPSSPAVMARLGQQALGYFGRSPKTAVSITISPATFDRCLKPKKHHLKRRLYGRTKPGTLLKHHIPIKNDSWDFQPPGFTETDLVSHSQLFSGRVHSLAQCHRHSFHLGGNSRRDRQKPNQGTQCHAIN
jgi:hypothetical protein